MSGSNQQTSEPNKQEDHPQGGQGHGEPGQGEPGQGEPGMPEAKPVKRRTLIILAVVAVVVAVIIVISGIVPRVRARKTLKTDTDQLAAPTVLVTKPTRAAPSQEVVLPANIQAFMDAPIYARTSGYVRKWYYDLGAHVKKGQLLADIESPEVDQQLAQAKADLRTAQTNAGLAQVTSDRYTGLLQSNSVSQQDTDNAINAFKAQSSTVQSMEANVNRLQQLVDFEKVTAPFDGVITARNTDVGQLVNAGNGGAVQELFHIADIKTLRVFVSVPEVYSNNATVGLTPYLTLAQYPNRKFAGKLVRTSHAIDPASRTLNVEIDLNNAEGELLPGGYAEVHIPVHDGGVQTFTLPVGSLMFRSEGLRIATVTPDSKAKLISITPGRDYGATIEVLSGITGNEDIITNPPDSVVDGEQVRIVQPQNTANSGSGGNSTGGPSGSGSTEQSGSSQGGAQKSGTPGGMPPTPPQSGQQQLKSGGEPKK